MLLSSVLIHSGCDPQATGVSEDPLVITPLVRPQGALRGPTVSATIGPEGGVLRSQDEALLVEIPAGALASATTVSITPVSNTNIAGIGTAFRLTPHGQQFAKPVTITYGWYAHADSVGLMQTLGLAYQMEDGVWKYVGADNFSAAHKTVTFKTTHFSDWSLMNRVSLSPHRVDLETGEKEVIKALIFTQADWGDLFVPLVNNPNGPYNEPGYPVGIPQPLPSKYIKSWKLTGPGNLNRSTGQAVEYKAPRNVNGTASATVSLELNSPVSGSYELLSHITIMGDGWVELSINGSTPVRFPVTPVAKVGSRYILSNPEDEGGGQFLLTWNGGLGSHAFDLAADGTRFHFLTGAGTGYGSMYMPGPDSPPTASEGNVHVTRLSDGRAEGTFSLVNVGVGSQFRPEARAEGRFKARLFIP